MASKLTEDDDNDAPPVQRQGTEASIDAPSLILSSGHEIGVYRDGISGNLTLLSSGDKTPLYFIRCSVFRRKSPDVVMFAGSDDTGEVVGVCGYAALSTSIKVGRGDPSHPNSMEWEELTKTSRDHSAYKFSVWSPGRAERQSYSWKRTHDPNIKDNKSSKLDRRSWKLEDDRTGEVVAAFVARGVLNSWNKMGKFRIVATGEEAWEEWVLLTAIGMYEKARRRALARRDLSWFF